MTAVPPKPKIVVSKEKYTRTMRAVLPLGWCYAGGEHELVEHWHSGSAADQRSALLAAVAADQISECTDPDCDICRPID